MGPCGSVWAHIKTGWRPMAQDATWRFLHVWWGCSIFVIWRSPLNFLGGATTLAFSELRSPRIFQGGAGDLSNFFAFGGALGGSEVSCQLGGLGCFGLGWREGGLSSELVNWAARALKNHGSCLCLVAQNSTKICTTLGWISNVLLVFCALLFGVSSQGCQE